MKLESPAFANNMVIPDVFTCKGAGFSPPLQISHMPHDAQSMAIIMHDPDAPAGDWVHWLIWNIPPSTTEIAENTVPAGASEGINSFKLIGYGGPCPHNGTHHYVFELYALDSQLEPGSGATREDLLLAMEDHVLEVATLTGLTSAE